ncbi:class I SAM-dependent RNA methyltransferase [Humitalea sp. 24SJ18S-53]|uniref:class I SAM-dependent RNA methyltransferase n=1 Tax=Humitalea sp. 24SJ18S-53 TaxID=3422307 RepID=UPI003D679917
MSETVELAVSRLGASGDGVGACADGQACYVAGALPGESITARFTGHRGDAMVADLITVHTPSADRVTPPCPHVADLCGGCAVQHLSIPAGLEWKRDRLAEALSRAGATPEIAIAPPTLPGTRRRADLALLRRADGSVAVGLHARGSQAVVDLSTCLVLDPRLVALFEPLRAMLKRLSALRRAGSAIVNLLDTGPDLLLRTDGPLDAPGRGLIAAFANEHAIPRIAWAMGNAPPEMAAQTGTVGLSLSGAMLAPAPGAFLQASPGAEAAIIAAVLAGLPRKLTGKSRIADLYAGVGTLSLPLATRASIAAYEGDAEAVATLAAAAGRAGARIAAVKRDLARQPLLPAEIDRFVAVVLDPPFAGAAEQCAMLARSKGRCVIYVSCNPTALARDAKILLQGGFRITAATLVDQFLWSSQVESVLVFSRA